MVVILLVVGAALLVVPFVLRFHRSGGLKAAASRHVTNGPLVTTDRSSKKSISLDEFVAEANTLCAERKREFWALPRGKDKATALRRAREFRQIQMSFSVRLSKIGYFGERAAQVVGLETLARSLGNDTLAYMQKAVLGEQAQARISLDAAKRDASQFDQQTRNLGLQCEAVG